ncbi:MAG: glycosyltransferase family 39 protein, partial [Verrucomicrobia bacterium]|nr:glycosyltransferase family 39 protein [Verrucomicrobiota bacterium]
MKGRFWLLLVFLIVVGVFRFVIAANSELSPEEAYYYEWSHHPDICYYSKGPLVAWSILGSTALFGSSELGVRMLSPLLGFGTSLLIYLLGRRLYRERVGFWAAVAINLVPIFNVGSIVMTIDPLSIFLWTAGLSSFWLAQKEYNEGWIWWVVTGVLIGLGVLAKYTNAFELVSILILLVFSARLRREFIRPRIYLLLAAFLPFLILPIWWNQQHDWLALEHLSLSGGLSRDWDFSFIPLLQGLGALFVLYSPFLLASAFVALFASIPKARRNSKVNFLLAFTWPLLLAYVILSFKQRSDPSWTAPAFISLAILTAAWWLNLARTQRWVLVAGPIACGVSALFTFVALNTD